MSVLACVLVVFVLRLVLLLAGHLLPVRKAYMEKERPYECGFDPMNSSRAPFSFRFFLVAILFLIFDLEIGLLIPFIRGFYWRLGCRSLVVTLFLALLVLGLVYEWVKGGLEWAE